MTAKKPAKKSAAAPKADDTPETRPPGRPSSYTPEIADLICERLADGESLRAICASDDMPRRSTVFRWLAADEHKHFRDQYAHACEVRAEGLFDEILDIADTPAVGTKSVSKPTGMEITEGDMIEHRRLQIDVRKWVLSRMVPKKYGNQVEPGGGGGAPAGGIPATPEYAITPDEDVPDKPIL